MKILKIQKLRLQVKPFCMDLKNTLIIAWKYWLIHQVAMVLELPLSTAKLNKMVGFLITLKTIIINLILIPVPESPTAVKALVMSADSILVSWKPPTEPNGIVEYYMVYYKESGSDETEIPKNHSQFEKPKLKLPS